MPTAQHCNSCNPAVQLGVAPLDSAHAAHATRIPTLIMCVHLVHVASLITKGQHVRVLAPCGCSNGWQVTAVLLSGVGIKAISSRYQLDVVKPLIKTWWAEDGGRAPAYGSWVSGCCQSLLAHHNPEHTQQHGDTSLLLVVTNSFQHRRHLCWHISNIMRHEDGTHTQDGTQGPILELNPPNSL